MKLRPIRNDRDWRRAVKEIDHLMDSTRGSVEFDRLDVLAELVDRYESRRWPIEPADPVSAVRFCIEDRGVPRDQVIRAFGQRSHFHEFMAGNRGLPMRVAYRLNREFGIPAQCLLSPGGTRRRQTRHSPSNRRRAA